MSDIMEFDQLCTCAMFDSVRCRIELVSTTVADCHVFHSVSGRGLGLGTEAKQPHDCHKFKSLLNWVPGDFAHSEKRKEKKKKPALLVSNETFSGYYIAFHAHC